LQIRYGVLTRALVYAVPLGHNVDMIEHFVRAGARLVYRANYCPTAFGQTFQDRHALMWARTIQTTGNIITDVFILLYIAIIGNMSREYLDININSKIVWMLRMSVPDFPISRYFIKFENYILKYFSCCLNFIIIILIYCWYTVYYINKNDFTGKALTFHWYHMSNVGNSYFIWKMRTYFRLDQSPNFHFTLNNARKIRLKNNKYCELFKWIF